MYFSQQHVFIYCSNLFQVKDKKSISGFDGSESDEVIEAIEKQMTQVVYSEIVSGDLRHLTLRNLSHFSKYTVTIKACHAPSEGASANDPMLCSDDQSLDFRTPKKDGADDIDGKITSNQDKNNGTDVWITWNDPPDPNLAIVYYDFKLKMQHDASKSFSSCLRFVAFII